MHETDRNVVMRSLRQHGGELTMDDAAAKFKIPKGTIGRWAKEHREGKPMPARVIALAPPAESPARPIGVGYATKAKIEMRERLAATLGDDIREDLRAGTAALVKLIRLDAEAAVKAREAEDRGEAVERVDMRRSADASRALSELLDGATDLLVFDKSTATPGAIRAGADLMDADAVAQAFRTRARTVQRA